MKTSALVLGCLGLVLLGVVFFAMFGFGSYNKMVNLDEQVKSQWSQVENTYQRRADLIPNLVRTVQGYADFEKSTLQAVVEARARVGQVAAPTGGAPGTAGDPTSSPQAFQQFQAAQDNLGSALSRLLVVVENYPNLKANQNFLDLQSQLEGTENRITVERMRYNEVAQGYNAYIRRFPAFIIAKMTGFGPKEYFKSAPGSERAPEVQFQTK
ncbi:MAG: LemA family protein [Thermoanaerobaculia bacterium]